MSKRIWMVLPLLVLFAVAVDVGAANADTKNQAKQLLNQARNKINQNKYDQALQKAQQAVEKIEQLIQEQEQAQQQQQQEQQQQQQQAQVAPNDARFNNPLNINLDNTASVLDFVSYPGGDKEDRVRWDIKGMNSNSSLSGGRARLVIAASCFGEGTDKVQFKTGGQTFNCGQTLVDKEVTFNSKTGSVVIKATGGNATYVQWVLTGTATRVN